MPDDAVVDVEAEKKEANSDEILDRLDQELIGLVPVKTRIREIADLLVVGRLRRSRHRVDPAHPAHVLHRQPRHGQDGRTTATIWWSSSPVTRTRWIACLILDEQRYSFSEDAESAFRDHLERRMKQPRVANGRSVGNALERARLRQATRIVRENSKRLSRGDLMRIEAEDILASGSSTTNPTMAPPMPPTRTAASPTRRTPSRRSAPLKDGDQLC